MLLSLAAPVAVASFLLISIGIVSYDLTGTLVPADNIQLRLIVPLCRNILAFPFLQVLL